MFKEFVFSKKTSQLCFINAISSDFEGKGTKYFHCAFKIKDYKQRLFTLTEQEAILKLSDYHMLKFTGNGNYFNLPVQVKSYESDLLDTEVIEAIKNNNGYVPHDCNILPTLRLGLETVEKFIKDSLCKGISVLNDFYTVDAGATIKGWNFNNFGEEDGSFTFTGSVFITKADGTVLTKQEYTTAAEGILQYYDFCMLQEEAEAHIKKFEKA